ncbi:MAG: hypothetical protein WC003_06380 [Terrimicrobiaceae bacterium]
MNEQKEMPSEKNSPSPRFRYWFTPPESLAVKVADIEPFVPKANWKAPVPAGLTVEIPAEKIFSKNVPRIPLRLLADLLPDHVSSSDGMVKLPAAKLAATYRLVQHVEELPPEIPPEPENLPEPPPTPEAAVEPEENFGTLKVGAPEASPHGSPAPVVPGPVFPPAASGCDVPNSFAAQPSATEPPMPTPVVPEEAQAFVATDDPAPIPAIPAPEPQEATPVEPPKPASEEGRGAPSKFPPRRAGFVGLPLFRRKSPVPGPQAIPFPRPAPHVELPPANPPQEPAAPDIVLPSAPVSPPPPPDEPPVASVEPVPQIEPEPAAVPVRILRTEHFPRETQNQEIVEQEPLQALFLTEETMTVNRVIELCGGLPGINSCVLAHGSIVVASHNVPEAVDLVSMSAHAADMLKAMRDSSARMGVGTVPAVTLHTEKGVISFFNREDLTMLVFHKDRGFVPGVREKMAAVLGELTKARLTLPVGSDETTRPE